MICSTEAEKREEKKRSEVRKEKSKKEKELIFPLDFFVGECLDKQIFWFYSF